MKSQGGRRNTTDENGVVREREEEGRERQPGTGIKGVYSCRLCSKLHASVGERAIRGRRWKGGTQEDGKEKIRVGGERERERFEPFPESRKHDGAISQRLPVL